MNLAGELTRLHAQLADRAIPCGPGGHALVPRRVAEKAEWVWLDGMVRERDRPGETVLRVLAVDHAEIVALRCRGHGEGAPAPAAAWLAGTARLRLRLSQWLVRVCLDRLGSRLAAGTPLLSNPMIRGALADAVSEHLEVRAVLDASSAADLVADAHRRISVADRTLLRLLGASGFLADGPGQAAYVSELLADALGVGGPEGVT